MLGCAVQVSLNNICLYGIVCCQTIGHFLVLLLQYMKLYVTVAFIFLMMVLLSLTIRMLTVQVATTLHLLCLIAYGKLCKVSNGSLIVTVLTLDTVKKERK